MKVFPALISLKMFLSHWLRSAAFAVALSCVPGSPLLSQETNPPPHAPAPPPPADGRHPGRPPRFPLLEALDANHDGELSAEEIANASVALKTLDKDGDGKLSREELRPPPPPPDEGFSDFRGQNRRDNGPSPSGPLPRSNSGDGSPRPPRDRDQAVVDPAYFHDRERPRPEDEKTKGPRSPPPAMGDPLGGEHRRPDSRGDLATALERPRHSAFTSETTGKTIDPPASENPPPASAQAAPPPPRLADDPYVARLSSATSATREPLPDVSSQSSVLFDLLDTDHDGSLSDEEINNAPAVFKKLKRNKDGRITRDTIGAQPPVPAG